MTGQGGPGQRRRRRDGTVHQGRCGAAHPLAAWGVSFVQALLIKGFSLHPLDAKILELNRRLLLAIRSGGSR
jgi:hypothetical protein